MAAFWLAGFFTVPTILSDFSNGFFWSAMGNVVTLAAIAAMLVILHRTPHRYAVLINVALAVAYVGS